MSQPIATSFTLPNGTVLKNRLIKSAMSETLGTTDNRVTPVLAELYVTCPRTFGPLET